MAAQLEADKKTKSGKPSKIYKEISDEAKREALTANINFQMQMLADVSARGRVDLNNFDEVKTCAANYMQACAVAGSFPTFENLALSLGYGRSRLYKYLNAHPDSETAQFINLLQNSFASILQSQALAKNADVIMSIFLLKNSNLGYSDKSEIEIAPVTIEEDMQASEILKRYETLPDD